MKRTIFEAEHEALRETARQFLNRECLPLQRRVDQGRPGRS